MTAASPTHGSASTTATRPWSHAVQLGQGHERVTCRLISLLSTPPTSQTVADAHPARGATALSVRRRSRSRACATQTNPSAILGSLAVVHQLRPGALDTQRLGGPRAGRRRCGSPPPRRRQTSRSARRGILEAAVTEHLHKPAGLIDDAVHSARPQGVVTHRGRDDEGLVSLPCRIDGHPWRLRLARARRPPSPSKLTWARRAREAGRLSGHGSSGSGGLIAA